MPRLVLIWLSLPIMLFVSQGLASAWTRDLVATPALMGSPLQVIESRMAPGRIQRFESRMPDSPLQLIGSPFGPYRFATLPNLQDLRATRRALSTLPAMLQTSRGILLQLPYYVIPPVARYALVLPPGATEEMTAPVVAARPAAAPKFFSSRCGQFVQMTIPVETNLTDAENKPC